jgi:hypothetical protein
MKFTFRVAAETLLGSQDKAMDRNPHVIAHIPSEANLYHDDDE